MNRHTLYGGVHRVCLQSRNNIIMLDKQHRRRNEKICSNDTNEILLCFRYGSVVAASRTHQPETDCNSPLNVNYIHYTLYTRIIEIYARVWKIILKKCARNKINCE